MLKTSKLMAASAACVLVLAGCAAPAPAPAPAPPPPAPKVEPVADANAWTARLAALKTGLEAATQGLGVTLEQTADNQLHVVLPSDRSFDVGRANVKRDLAGVLDKIGEGLRSATRAQLLIAGHTDSTGTEAVNERLSLARANNARTHLVTRGVPADIVTTEGRGSREPVAENDSAAGRAQNRRVEIFISDKN